MCVHASAALDPNEVVTFNKRRTFTAMRKVVFRASNRGIYYDLLPHIMLCGVKKFHSREYSFFDIRNESIPPSMLLPCSELPKLEILMQFKGISEVIPALIHRMRYQSFYGHFKIVMAFFLVFCNCTGWENCPLLCCMEWTYSCGEPSCRGSCKSQFA